MEDDFEAIEEEILPEEPTALIEYIRRIEYGVGANLSGEDALILKNVRRKYGKLLSTVANELNSEDNHFLLELIQNAQDNEYGAGVEPAISFKATPSLLVVENNELGFTPQNVKSLCSAAESTKKDKTIFIGEKGIGFKSVFKVTDAPEIHSNGFHFRFLRTYGGNSGLGYILPHWHEPTTAITSGVTTLVLPAKNGFQFEDFRQLNPSLLLFLSKLRRIEVDSNNVRTLFRRVEKSDVTHLITEVSEGELTSIQEQKYITIGSVVSMADIVEERRKSVRESKLIFAFPLDSHGVPRQPSSFPVFAFLPVQDYGFRFIVHCDFVLTSNRESIQEPLRWNKRLRDWIPTAFLQAVDRFKSDEQLRAAYFDFLPRKGEIKNEFFKVARTELFEKLSQTECIFGESGRWLKPEQVLLASAKFRELIPSVILQELFGMDYPHSQVSAGAELLGELGCHPLQVSDVCSILSTHTTWFQKRPVSWKASFFAYLSSINNQSTLVSALKKIPCVPLANGKLAIPAEQPAIFFPLRGESDYGFEHELRILHSGIFAKAMKESEAVEKLFTALGVQRDDPYAIIHSYILPQHQQQNFGGSTDETLIAHLRYVKERWNEYKVGATSRGMLASAMRQLRGQMLVGTKSKDPTSGGWSFCPSDSLYLAREFQPSFSLEEISGVDIDMGLLVSDRYLSESERTSLDALRAWRAFLVDIGVASRPRVQRTADGGASCAPEIIALLSSAKKSVRKAVLEAFDSDWNSYDELTRAAITLGRSGSGKPTVFVEQLRSVVAPTKRRNSFKVSESYSDTAEVRSFFGEAANYIDARISNASLLAVCGITFRVDAQACLRRLREAKSGAKLSRDQLRHIFNRLEECWKQDQVSIDHAFRTERLIPLTIEEGTQWFSATEVTWRSPPSQVRVLEKLSPSLAGRYSDHFHFFTRLLRVQGELPVGNWVDGLALLKTIDDPAEQHRTATAIYQKLSSCWRRWNIDQLCRLNFDQGLRLPPQEVSCG